MDNFNKNKVTFIEEEKPVFSVMSNRIKALKQPGRLPDIIYILRETTSFSLLGKGSLQRAASYFFVYGFPTYDVNLLSVYISKIKGNSKNSKDIKKIIFCSHCLFSQMDCRILFNFPGGMQKIFFVNEKEATQVSTDNLIGPYFSSLLSYWTLSETNENTAYFQENETIDFYVKLNENFIEFASNKKQLVPMPLFEETLAKFAFLLSKRLKQDLKSHVAISIFPKSFNLTSNSL